MPLFEESDTLAQPKPKQQIGRRSAVKNSHRFFIPAALGSKLTPGYYPSAALRKHR
jgi:hypothetical protein